MLKYIHGHVLKIKLFADFYSNCGLCKRRLTIGGICTLGMTKKEVEEMNILLREDMLLYTASHPIWMYYL
jgi:hypothetical protein